jgi:hypothetical protein
MNPEQKTIDFEAARKRYPVRSGYKEKGGTSQDAANAIEATGRAQLLRDRVLQHFQAGHESTADEVAAVLDEHILSIRPRCSELRERKLITTTGKRRQSSGGKMSNVWRLKRSDE